MTKTGELTASHAPGNSVGLLFSGGRDSTLAAVRLAREFDQVTLISCLSGLGTGHELRQIRVDELLRYAPGVFKYVPLPNHGLVRFVCFQDLVKDIDTDRVQLILLGEAVAMVVRAGIYAKQNGISRLAFGATSYQDFYPEQRAGVLRILTEFLAGMGVEFLLPVRDVRSEESCREQLGILGLSSKSLESTTLLADLDVDIADNVCEAYVERKLRPAFDRFMRTWAGEPLWG